MSIDVLPDEVLLQIFDFYVCEDMNDVEVTQKEFYEVWQSLVHVCRRWRSIVFGSPRHLDLRLCCTAKTPARDTLDVWPALPLSIECNGDYCADNIIAVLERSDRVEDINLSDVGSGPDWEKVLAAMQVPFPELMCLKLCSIAETMPVLPKSFLGQSAPSLDTLSLNGISFPWLPKLLLSATFLTYLYLKNIPYSGYISPEAMLTALSTLTSLESIWLGCGSFQYCPYRARRLPPSPTRFVLPVLTFFRFEGVSEYLEYLVAHIDAPHLRRLRTFFFDENVFGTQVPRLVQFIRCTSILKAFEKASVIFEDGTAIVKLWQLSNLEQVCTSALPAPFTSEDDYMFDAQYVQPDWRDNIEETLWLELLHPFTGVKNLYLSEEFAERVVPTLPELVGSRTTEVLPTLQNIFLEGFPPSGPVQEGIQQFVASRQVTSHPVTVSQWDKLGDRTPYDSRKS